MFRIPFLSARRRREESAPAVEATLRLVLSTRAPATQRHYRAILREFEASLEGRALLSATEADVAAYAAECLGRAGERSRGGTEDETCSPSTVRHKCIILHALFDRLGRRGDNPFRLMCEELRGAQAGDKRPTQAITAAQVRRLLSVPDTRCITGARDAALLVLLFGGGLRISEACGLRLGELRRDADGLTYAHLTRTKGRRVQDQVIPDWAAGDLWAWAAARRAAGATAGDPFLVRVVGGTHGPALTTRTAFNLFKRLAKAAGLGPEVTPHSGRATACTIGLESGWSRDDARIFLRHAGERMVATYDKRAHARSEHPGRFLLYVPDRTCE